ncbi:hypothetical protein NPIL_274271 [Nephila pilipes]|uniref:Protein hunchback n=1 Tax=Nephila pilipes TaxID=299642 RepID=A0A8X6NQX6_NEPPI|nr:hypothetical protein NPIL_274271 [Nephila pilipes]
MSTALVTELYSYMSFEFKTPTELFNLHPYSNLNNKKMPPLEQNTIQPSPKGVEYPTSEELQPSQETVAEASASDTNSLPSSANNNDSKIENYYSTDSCSLDSSSQNQEDDQKDNQRPLQSSFKTEKLPSENFKRNLNSPNLKSRDVSKPGRKKMEFDGIYRCSECTFTAPSDDLLHQHLLFHFPYECTLCGFLTDTKARSEAHMASDHPLGRRAETNKRNNKKIPQKTRAEITRGLNEKARKPRKTPCKLCDVFVGECKAEYYIHLDAAHSDSGRLLRCPECIFIAVYKHHFEYHVKLHNGEKPYKCDKCFYECVNKSMLNSHYKSHSNIYQYSCKNCPYVTKYLHSLKMHLRKYNHKPGQTLNSDGSVNTSSVIDVHGRRRGPKNKKQKAGSESNKKTNDISLSKNTPSSSSSSYSSLPPSNQIIYSPNIYNHFSGQMYVKSPPREYSSGPVYRQPAWGGENNSKCCICEFESESSDEMKRHMEVHFMQTNVFDLVNNYTCYMRQYMPPYACNSYQLNGFPNGFPTESHVKKAPTAAESRSDGQSAGANGQSPNNEVTRKEGFVSTPSDYEEIPINKVGYPKHSLNVMEQQRPAQVNEKLEVINKNENRSNSSSPEIIANKISYLQTHRLPPNQALGKFEDFGYPVPLDLSQKSPVQTETRKNKNSESPVDLEALIKRKSNLQKQNCSPQQTIRNRRKGKAFKRIPCEDPNSDFGGSQMEPLENIYKSSTLKSQETITNNSTPFRPTVRNSVPLNFKSATHSLKMKGYSSYKQNQIVSPYPKIFTKQQSTSIGSKETMHHSEYSPITSTDKSFRANTVHSSHSHADAFSSYQQNFNKQQSIGMRNMESFYSPITSPDKFFSTPNSEQPYLLPNMAQEERMEESDSENTKCHYCIMDFGNVAMFSMHFSYHSQDGDPFVCAKCKLPCKDKIGFNDHVVNGSRINGMCLNGIRNKYM